MAILRSSAPINVRNFHQNESCLFSLHPPSHYETTFDASVCTNNSNQKRSLFNRFFVFLTCRKRTSIFLANLVIFSNRSGLLSLAKISPTYKLLQGHLPYQNEVIIIRDSESSILLLIK